MRRNVKGLLLCCILLTVLLVLVTSCEDQLVVGVPSAPNKDTTVNTTDDSTEVSTDDSTEDSIVDSTVDSTVETTHSHLYGDWIVEKSPTCTESGIQFRECGCGERETLTVDALQHTVITDEGIAPTCTESGITEGQHCSACGEILQAQETVEATGHKEIIDAAVAPTCVASGLTAGKHCETCGVILLVQESVAATGHTEVVDAAVAPTCVATGLTEGKHCRTCGKILRAQGTVAATGHSVVIDKAVDATCVDRGLTEGKHCKTCGYVIKAQVTVAAKGHSVVVDKAVAATCEETGLTEGRHCQVCQVILLAQTVTAANGHSTVTDKAVAPTCVTNGLTEGSHCKVCNKVFQAQKTIAALGHTKIIDGAVAPTCTDEGLTEGIHCGVCYEVLKAQQVVAANGHTQVKEAYVAPTCTDIGWDGATACSACGLVFSERVYIRETGHTVEGRDCIHCEYQRKDFSDIDIYASDFGYKHLGELTNGQAMQTFYQRLDTAMRSFHEDTTRNATTVSEFHPNNMSLDRVYYKDLGLSYEESTLVVCMLMCDRPVYYWLAHNWVYNDTYGWICLEVVGEYARGAVRAEYNAMVYRVAEEYYAVVETEEYAYNIALAYHDMIISAINYVYEDDGKTPEDAKWAHSVIGVFDGRGAVCEGYAKAFQLLLNVSGVENTYVAGQANGSHGWNLVRLDDGEWYWFDLTWDDLKRNFREISYNYFAVTDTTSVLWYDALAGFNKPRDDNVTFLENHTPDLGGNYDFQFLPERAESPYADENVLEFGEVFTVGENTYAVIGYNVVRLVSTTSEDKVVIPETVMYGGRVYDVISVGGMDEDGYFIYGTVLTCDTVTEITVSGSVIRVDRGAFVQAFNLNRVTLSEGVEEIITYGFFNCYNLKEVVLPSTLKVIDYCAFAYCYKLEAIYFNGTVEEWNAIEKDESWNKGSDLITVYCTDGIIG